MTTRGAGPLNWRTNGGYTPESVRRSRTMGSFPALAVVAMLDAADEAHTERLYEENERGGEAREVVAAVARMLGVVLEDTGVGQSMWDPANMRRVVRAAEILKDDRVHWESIADGQAQEIEKLRDLLRVEHERANAAIKREETSDAQVEELSAYAAKIERERDNYKQAYELKPASWRLEGPGVEELAARIDDIAELRATIVSQAREIARLKGESA